MLSRSGKYEVNAKSDCNQEKKSTSLGRKIVQLKDAKLIQKLLPTRLSFDHGFDDNGKPIKRPHPVFTNFKFSPVIESSTVRLNVYRLKESMVGLYHSGVEFRGLEYTYCCGIGICYHKPRKCQFAILLGSIRLGEIDIDLATFQGILKGKQTTNGCLSLKPV